jgi:LysM repeat protein
MLSPMHAPDGSSPHIDTTRRPSAGGEATTTAMATDIGTTEAAPFRGCPFLVAGSGGWRLDQPSREHRCGAVSPSAPLSPEKQVRLCLTPAHASCATLQASLAARDARLGSRTADRTTRWGLARTTIVIEEAGGLRSRITGLLLDRGRWPAIPAVILVVTLIVLAASGLRPAGSGAGAASASPATTAAVPTAIATIASTAAPTQSSTPTARPTTAPTPRPTARPTATPSPSAGFVTYTVKSGDTLSAIASKFHTTSQAIAVLNGISVTSTLHIGQVLRIPTS